MGSIKRRERGLWLSICRIIGDNIYWSVVRTYVLDHVKEQKMGENHTAIPVCCATCCAMYCPVYYAVYCAIYRAMCCAMYCAMYRATCCAMIGVVVIVVGGIVVRG